MCAAPARLAGLDDRKGAIARRLRRRPRGLGSGRASSSSSRRRLQHRHKLTPYARPDAARRRRRRRSCGARRVWDDGRLARQAPASCYERRFTDLDRSRRRAARRRGRRGQRRVLRARRRTCSRPSRRSSCPRQVHRSRQVDGRLGDPPPARAGLRLVHRPARPAGRRPRRRRRHRVLPRQLSGVVLARRLATIAGCADPDALDERDVERVLPRVAARGATRRTSFAVDATPRPRHAPAAQHLSRRRRRAAAGVRRGRARLGRGCGGGGEVDLAAVEHGGVVVACSDMFFGIAHNLIMPGARATWATAGRRSGGAGPGTTGRSCGSARPATIERVEVDTRHFKGNAPGACCLEVCACGGADADVDRPRRASGASSCRGRRCSPTRATVRRELAAVGRRDPRAAQHLSGRRRGAAAAVRRAGLKR